MDNFTRNYCFCVSIRMFYFSVFRIGCGDAIRITSAECIRGTEGRRDGDGGRAEKILETYMEFLQLGIVFGGETRNGKTAFDRTEITTHNNNGIDSG